MTDDQWLDDFEIVRAPSPDTVGRVMCWKLKDIEKTAIRKRLLEARIDQMEYVNQRMIGKNTSGDRVFYDKDAVIAENKLLDQQRIIFKAMMAELQAQLKLLEGEV